MLGRLLSRLTSRGATAQTILDTGEIRVGDTLSGTVHVRGGDTGQDIRAIVVEIVARCLVEGRGGDKVPMDIVVSGGRFEAGRIEPGAEAHLAFDMEIPLAAPVSLGRVETFLRTELDIASGRDSGDLDPVVLYPSDTMAAVFDGIREAGFEFVEAEWSIDRVAIRPSSRSSTSAPSRAAITTSTRSRSLSSRPRTGSMSC